MRDSYDVVVVGAGIAGSALASALARDGMDVLVLEQSDAYRDRVRGETIVPWGTLEVERLGLTDTLLGAGGEFATTFVPYDELMTPEQAEASAMPIAMFCAGAKGQLNVGHPQACEALSVKAAADGAEVLRGIHDVKVTFGPSPRVAWGDAAGLHEVGARIVVGADGRHSTVRRQAGIELDEREAVTFGAGLLVKADSGFTEKTTIGTEGDVFYLAFPRTGDLTRLYLLVDIARQREFTGPDRLERFRQCFHFSSFPASEALAAGEAAGPAGGAPMTDSWTTTPPMVDGAVLIGDAAGWNDPIIGQGLSIAFRDARTVVDVLTGGSDWSPAAFTGYVDERAERMRRLAIAARITTEMRSTFGDAARERRARYFASYLTDPIMLSQVAVQLAGPEVGAPEAFTDQAVAATLAV